VAAVPVLPAIQDRLEAKEDRQEQLDREYRLVFLAALVHDRFECHHRFFRREGSAVVAVDLVVVVDVVVVDVVVDDVVVVIGIRVRASVLVDWRTPVRISIHIPVRIRSSVRGTNH